MANIEPTETAKKLSLFRPLGYQRSSCGYCKSEVGSAAYYTGSIVVHPEHYDELVNRGWRRSGTLYYKQNLRASCCPFYTLRLPVSEFKARKDQRKAINRWTKFVLGPEYMRKAARLCPKSREEKRHRKCNFDLLSAVHEAEYDNVKRPVDPETKRPLEPAHRFEVTTEGDNLTQAKFDLFRRYQAAVHKEEFAQWKPKDFARFLCSGIKRSPEKADSKQLKLGSWHQCYRLDGKLIAVGVLDFMPSGVSSVYLFYDPSFEQWEFGKLSALREIALALESPYPYYYMGFYIHSCQKMRYKAAYRPQQILDPESLTWDPLDGELSKKLDERPYVSLSRDRRLGSQASEPATQNAQPNPDSSDEDMSLFDLHMPGALTVEQVEELDLDHWLLFFQKTFFSMNDLVGWEDMSLRSPRSIKGIIAELAAVLGPKLVKQSAVALV